ncbi:MAG: ABC transporter ATP-binding protein [Acidimicrobiales bacterium]
MVLDCRNLVVSYDSHRAVDDVSLKVHRGEVFGLLGPNGAGKTSVIRALTTIVPIDSGSVRLAGHGLDDPQSIRGQIGLLPESTGYPGTQTAVGHLRFIGRLHGLSKSLATERAETLLERFGLGGEHRPIATFSRGMRQRLGLCRALINEPAVLFLDEPTLGLDPAGKEVMLAYIAHVASQDGTAVMLCSHLLDEVERVCHRVAVMDRGRIVAIGSVPEVIAVAGANVAGGRLSDAFLAITESHLEQEVLA